MNHSHLEAIAISALFRFAHFWKVFVEAALLGRLQLTVEPAYHAVGFEGIRPVAIETLERAPTFAARRQR